MAMTVIEGIHQRWAATPALCAVLPATRLWTGISADSSLPRAVVRLRSDKPLTACNDGAIVRGIGVRVQVFHGSYAAATTIVEQVKAAFERADFDLGDGNRVIDMRHTDSAEDERADGVWRIAGDFLCTVSLAAAKA